MKSRSEQVLPLRLTVMQDELEGLPKKFFSGKAKPISEVLPALKNLALGIE
ncbi:MAG: hypothetical protein VCA36_02720 [Opitutales bacterium]